jgi:hypothetical protein
MILKIKFIYFLEITNSKHFESQTNYNEIFYILDKI